MVTYTLIQQHVPQVSDNKTHIVVRDMILSAGYTQRAFARKIGVSAAYLSDVLNGRRAMSARVARLVGSELRLDGEALYLRQGGERYRDD